LRRLPWLLTAVLLTATTPVISAPLAGDGTWKRLGPAPRCWGPTAVFDPLRNRMLAFGGSPFDNVVANSYDVVWSLSLTGTPSWTSLTNRPVVPGSGPYGRESASAIYDPVRDRMIVFGGTGGNTYNDVWALSLSGTPTWTEITPVGPAPGPRRGHTAIYDPVRDRMLVFAGNNASLVDLSDVWALSLSGTPAWTQITPAGTPPQARGWHTAIYDPVRDRMVVFGGYDWPTTGSFGDTWSLALSGTPTWSPLAASGSVSARNSHSAIYDPVGDRMVVYGGYADPDNPLKLSVLAFAGGGPAWSQITPAGTAPPMLRDGAAGVYDAPNQRIVYYAGIDPDFANVWAVTLSGTPTWSAIAPVGTSGRRQGPTLYDSARDRMVVLTGGSGTLVPWALSLAGEPAWSRTVPGGDAFPVGGFMAAIYDPNRDRAVVFASYNVDPPEIWTLDFATSVWSRIIPAGTPPTQRYAVSAIYDPMRDRMIVFGGSIGGGQFTNEAWAINFGAQTSWAEIPTAGGPPAARDGHIAIYDSDRDDMVIFGGEDAWFSYVRDAWKLDLGSNTWTEIVPVAGLPSDHIAMSGIYDAPRERLLFFGGANPNLTTSELWALSLAGPPVWTLLAPAGLIPPERVTPGMIHDPVRDRVIINGGNIAGDNYDDTWAYSPGANVAVPEPHGHGSATLALAPPRPNPSREQTSFAFTLARSGHAALEVFDTNGRRVRTLVETLLPAGPHTASWRGDDDRGQPVRGGLYFVRLRCGGEEVTRRVARVQ
jgi:hypothetical protein